MQCLIQILSLNKRLFSSPLSAQGGSSSLIKVGHRVVQFGVFVRKHRNLIIDVLIHPGVRSNFYEGILL